MRMKTFVPGVLTGAMTLGSGGAALAQAEPAIELPPAGAADAADPDTTADDAIDLAVGMAGGDTQAVCEQFQEAMRRYNPPFESEADCATPVGQLVTIGQFQNNGPITHATEEQLEILRERLTAVDADDGSLAALGARVDGVTERLGDAEGPESIEGLRSSVAEYGASQAGLMGALGHIEVAKLSLGVQRLEREYDGAVGLAAETCEAAYDTLKEVFALGEADRELMKEGLDEETSHAFDRVFEAYDARIVELEGEGAAERTYSQKAESLFSLFGDGETRDALTRVLSEDRFADMDEAYQSALGMWDNTDEDEGLGCSQLMGASSELEAGLDRARLRLSRASVAERALGQAVRTYLGNEALDAYHTAAREVDEISSQLESLESDHQGSRADLEERHQTLTDAFAARTADDGIYTPTTGGEEDPYHNWTQRRFETQIQATADALAEADRAYGEEQGTLEARQQALVASRNRQMEAMGTKILTALDTAYHLGTEGLPISMEVLVGMHHVLHGEKGFAGRADVAVCYSPIEALSLCVAGAKMFAAGTYARTTALDPETTTTELRPDGSKYLETTVDGEVRRESRDTAAFGGEARGNIPLSDVVTFSLGPGVEFLVGNDNYHTTRHSTSTMYEEVVRDGVRDVVAGTPRHFSETEEISRFDLDTNVYGEARFAFRLGQLLSLVVEGNMGYRINNADNLDDGQLTWSAGAGVMLNQIPR